MINWKVRLKNKHWVLAFVSQVMIVLQMILSGLNMLGLIHFELTQTIQSSILTFINAIFVILSMLGLVQDPTTKGYGDSDRAMNYKDPN
ncbi:phage holin [Bacillus xiapuensis]|uniref:Phage holin n=1 Tax=Bacillus xiapuensis TaxID=2014075 RepID=A0ABU6N9R2_9BACI|nr:phage holin [Bacillus xiapuensis]